MGDLSSAYVEGALSTLSVEGVLECGKLWCLVCHMWKVLRLLDGEIGFYPLSGGRRGVSGRAGAARMCAENAPSEQWELLLSSLGSSVTIAGKVAPNHLIIRGQGYLKR